MTCDQTVIQILDLLWWVITGSVLVFCIPGIIALAIALRLRFYRK